MAPKQVRYFRGAAAASFLGGMVRPALREQADDIRAAWQTATSHAIDRIQNSGFISGVVDASVASVVGSGLILAARPEREALGWSEKKAEEWSAKVESRFKVYSANPLECDAGARMNFAQQQIAAYKSYLYYGEILARLPMFRRGQYGGLTKVLLLPPSRLSETATDVQNRVKHGVKMDAYGAAIAYIIKMVDQYGYMVDREFAARNALGRQGVIHVFDPMLMGVRGITPLAPALKVCAQVEQLADATLSATLLQTMFAATIRNNTPGLQAFSGLMTEDEQGQATDKVMNIDQFVDVRGDWYESAKLNLHQHGRVAHLFPNDELEFHEAKHPSENYDNFAGWLLREIARCAGVTYEEASGDYRGATYSSVRIGTATMWPIVMQRRQNIAGVFCQSVYEAWLEEEIGEGRIEFDGGLDGFLANKAAACAAWWNGPAAPQADDLKTARADETLIKIGATTLEAVSAKYGRDWRDDMKQRKREKDLALSLGLPDPHKPVEERAAEFKRSEQGTDDDKTDNPSYTPDT
ncbi:phage portal protein [Bosea sp. (in: a-proteobacteria)]|uniref:phage portal protein n=1 Tax=Bosea sp. (in: a-proteobacteria) TaxID=1871050 RepID=UPI001AC1E015|nr:phage portal protein [Bosea sp. (in: a-proteobacteria)]MBN9444371.1 phage portal protein [Bosea sp. (in: a-proteobacteria)]